MTRSTLLAAFLAVAGCGNRWEVMVIALWDSRHILFSRPGIATISGLREINSFGTTIHGTSIP